MIVTRAPLRLSFFGGGSDFPEVFSRQRGAVLSTAIGFSTHVAASTPPPGVFERPIRLFHERIERCADVAQIDHPLMRASLRTWPDSRPLEVHASGDLPSGSGLGSSSSFCVALLAALDELEGARRQPIELALSAIELERRVEKGAVGYQDQVMAALGGFRRIEFRSEDDVRAESLPVSAERLRQLEECLALVYVGGRRSAPSLERRKLERVERNLDTLRA
ncbi:MAG: GHMP kinase, partial [Acidobacteriota bacterium]